MYTDIRNTLSLWAVHVRLWLDFKVFNPLKSLTHEKRKKKYIYIYLYISTCVHKTVHRKSVTTTLSDFVKGKNKKLFECSPF